MSSPSKRARGRDFDALFNDVIGAAAPLPSPAAATTATPDVTELPFKDRVRAFVAAYDGHRAEAQAEREFGLRLRGPVTVEMDDQYPYLWWVAEPLVAVGDHQAAVVALSTVGFEHLPNRLFLLDRDIKRRG